MSVKNINQWKDRNSFHNDSTDEWATPRRIWKPLSDAVGGFDLDSASGCEPQPIATEQYTEQDDGLSEEWYGQVWCNPPYSSPVDWISKAVDEHEQGNTERILLLLPARTNTNWFSDHINHADALLLFNRKLSFLSNGEKEKDAFPTPMMLVVFGEVNQELAEYGDNNGLFIELNEQRITLSDFEDDA
jgi:phage N-6-adenine-methyltransferase